MVGEECVAFMLNWRENDYLTLQVSPSLVMNNPYIKVTRLCASFFNTFMKFSLSSSSSDAISDIHQHEIIAKLSTQ